MQNSQLWLETKIGKIKEEIMALGLEHAARCAHAAIQCLRISRLSLQGGSSPQAWPYYQLSFTRKGKSRTQFVRRHELNLVQEQVRNYQRLKKLTDRWVALGMALSRLRLRGERETRNVSERNS